MAMCYCNRASQRKITRAGQNKDRPFWTCATRSCRWFAWADESSETVDIGGLLLKRSDRPQKGNGLCKCGSVAVVTAMGKRKTLRCAWERCSFFQGLASKPIPPAPTASAQNAEESSRILIPVSQLVNRPKRLACYADVQPCSAMERHDGMLPYVLIARDGSETQLPDVDDVTINCARSLQKIVSNVSARHSV